MTQLKVSRHFDPLSGKVTIEIRKIENSSTKEPDDNSHHGSKKCKNGRGQGTVKSDDS